MSKRKERGEEREEKKREKEREKPTGEYSDCVKKNEKFSTTDREENDLGVRVCIFAVLTHQRETKEHNQIQLINNEQIK